MQDDTQGGQGGVMPQPGDPAGVPVSDVPATDQPTEPAVPTDQGTPATPEPAPEPTPEAPQTGGDVTGGTDQPTGNDGSNSGPSPV